jgi:hypothetical protein
VTQTLKKECALSLVWVVFFSWGFSLISFFQFFYVAQAFHQRRSKVGRFSEGRVEANPGLKDCHCFDCADGRGVSLLCKEYALYPCNNPKKKKNRGAGCLPCCCFDAEIVFKSYVRNAGTIHTVCQPRENLEPHSNRRKKGFTPVITIVL